MDRFSRLRELREGHARGDDPATPLTPDGSDLALTVRCYTSRDSTEYATHSLTVRADGTVDLPHDLDAERVAVAFGSYSSCLDLVDHGLPAVRAMLPLLARRARVPLIRDPRGRWRIPRDRTARCCTGTTFPDPARAIEHLRDPWHARHAHGGTVEPLVRPLSLAVETAWADARPAGPDVERLVLESDGIDELWRAGIHPDELAALAAPAAAVGGALPVAYFVRMRYGSVDPGWFETVLAGRPDPDFAAWLAAREHDARDASAWAAWLKLGLSTHDAEFAIEQGMLPSTVDQVAAATGWAPWLAARTLVAWASAGCAPATEQLVALARRGLEHARPRSAAIDALVADLAGDADHRLTATEQRTELGVMLTLLGTRRDVVQRVRSGIRTVADLLAAEASEAAASAAARAAAAEAAADVVQVVHVRDAPTPRTTLDAGDLLITCAPLPLDRRHAS